MKKLTHPWNGDKRYVMASLLGQTGIGIEKNRKKKVRTAFPDGAAFRRAGEGEAYSHLAKAGP